MDDFIDPFLSSSSWSDHVNASSRSSWGGSIESQSNGLLTDSIVAYGDEKSLPVCMISSPHIMSNVAAGHLDLHAHAHIMGNETHENNFSLKDVYESKSTSGSYGRELNTSCSVTLPNSALTVSSSIESNGSEPSKFDSISSVPSMWPPSYSGISPFMEQGKLESFGFQGVESNADELGKTYIENGKHPHLDNSAAAASRHINGCNGINSTNFSNLNLLQQMKMTNGGLHPHQEEQNGVNNLHLPSFTAGSLLNLSKSSGVQACQQLAQSTEGNILKNQTSNSSIQHQATPANNGNCNGTTKPRVRARRGQATDPHSIAERLRREKIAERMKNLQELVPNSNKTDKASMLDEIIDYVKFLQLQVKVLSMSRLGAAGAVVPLITDIQAEGSGTLHLSSIGNGSTDLSEAEDNLAFEQEVVKLMESNVTAAMQFLQNKGLCLMPIALASAISTQKGSSSASIPPERRKSDVGVTKKEEP
ncbi:uncharacterized protein A4U43_C08F26990 [Asparagus officinalis]|uniref:transcription factor bHLH7-like n=1 Tax=Asparagus officinalis TaxID=4686 RepID=UPI00098E6C77|nr:transcription factor bHLH7-like [Asparagus officinalis]XP_020241187.1 transcription factor bHLH7-like [Asparagus officinalis]ONK61174.1 uncharacterized protein A4U43_C08F26990 [Asparagus officinalis]